MSCAEEVDVSVLVLVASLLWRSDPIASVLARLPER